MALYEKSKRDPKTKHVSRDKLTGGRLGGLYKMVLEYRDKEERGASIMERGIALEAMKKEVVAVWSGERSRWYHTSVKTKHKDALYALWREIETTRKALEKESKRIKKARATLVPKKTTRSTLSVVKPIERKPTAPTEAFWGLPPLEELPMPLDVSSGKPGKTEKTVKVTLADLMDNDWDEELTKDADFAHLTWKLGRDYLTLNEIDVFVIRHREEWDNEYEPVQYLVNFKRRFPVFFGRTLWPELRKATDAAELLEFVDGLKGTEPSVILCKRPYMRAAMVACVQETDLRLELQTAVENDSFMRHRVISDAMLRFTRSQTKYIDILNPEGLSLGQRQEALRRLLSVQCNLVSQPGNIRPNDLEIAESVGMDAGALVAICDATYATLTSGRSAMNYLGPSAYGMPIECLTSILSIVNLIRSPGDSRSETVEKTTMLTLSLGKKGVDMSTAIGTSKWKDHAALVPSSALPALAGTSGGLGIVTGLYDVVQARSEWRKATHIKERFEYVAMHQKSFVHKLRDMPKSSPLRMFHDKIVHGKLGRRRVRAFAKGVGGLTSTMSGGYVLALALGASAVPVVGWSLVAAGVLLALATMTYTLTRRALRQKAYTEMREKSKGTWYYPAFIKTKGEYYRAVIAAFMHRTLCAPAPDKEEYELAVILAWIMFGNDAETSLLAARSAGVAGIMELLRG